jgi:hypothetical protein
VGTPNLDSLNVNKRADYSSYNTAVDLLNRWEYRLYCSSQTVYSEITLAFEDDGPLAHHHQK